MRAPAGGDLEALKEQLHSAHALAITLKSETHRGWKTAQQRATDEAGRWQALVLSAVAVESEARERKAAVTGDTYFEAQVVQLVVGTTCMRRSRSHRPGPSYSRTASATRQAAHTTWPGGWPAL